MSEAFYLSVDAGGGEEAVESPLEAVEAFFLESIFGT